MRKLLLFLVLLMLLFPLSTFGENTSDMGSPDLKISEVYYHSDPGCKYITLGNWGEETDINGYNLTDEEGYLILPSLVLKKNEQVTIAEEEDAFEDIWGRSPDLVINEDVERKGQFNPATAGDGLLLKKEGELVDSFYYGNGTGGDGWSGRWVGSYTKGKYAKRGGEDTDTREDWDRTRDLYIGHSDFDSKTIDLEGSAKVFSSPGNSFSELMRYIDRVEHELNISVYQIESVRIAEKIANVSEDGIEVNILVDGSPVGGFTDRQMYCLNLIEKSGGSVHLINDEAYSPYSFLHTKYMVADGSSLLLASENLGYTGFPINPTRGNRGWGIILNDRQIADYYSKVFRSDWSFSKRFEPSEPSYNTFSSSQGRYKPIFESREFKGPFKVTPVLSPDTSTSKDTILRMIDSAEDSISVQQFYIKDFPDRENPYLSHIKKAAKRGCDVRIILDSTWYNVQENETDNDDMVERLNNYSEEENLSLEAKLIEWEKGFSKVHNKGMIVDGEKVLISSINWNANSMLQNREAGVIVEDERIGEYFLKIFNRDWKEDISSPIADAGRDREVEKGKIIRFRGEACWDENNISLYKWDLDGDGEYDKTGPNVSRLYRESGSTEIKLYVEDEYGNSDTDTMEIKVVEPGEGIVSSTVPGDSSYDAYIASGVMGILGAVVIYYLRRRDVL